VIEPLKCFGGFSSIVKPRPLSELQLAQSIRDFFLITIALLEWLSFFMAVNIELPKSA
jgi:hypothetical protein